MIKTKKEIDLLSYLPPFLREYEEIKSALKAENPEFKLIWEQTEKILDNSFIDRADEYGIKRFEKLLGILPEADSNIEVRRSVVKAKWLSKLPYTYRMLLKQLEIICGDDFSVTKSFETDYYLRVVTHLRDYEKALEVKKLLDEMIPANMRLNYHNSITFKSDKSPSLYTGAKLYGKHKKIVATISRY